MHERDKKSELYPFDAALVAQTGPSRASVVGTTEEITVAEAQKPTA